MVGPAATYDLYMDPEAPRQLGDLEEAEPERRAVSRTGPVKKTLDQFLAEFDERLRDHPGEAATSATAALEGRADGTWRTPVEGGERMGRRLPRRAPWRRPEGEPRPLTPVADVGPGPAEVDSPPPPATATAPAVVETTPAPPTAPPIAAPAAAVPDAVQVAGPTGAAGPAEAAATAAQVSEEPATMEAAEASGLLDAVDDQAAAPAGDPGPASKRRQRHRRRHRHR
jgi:hypothetical protein